jgi:uncharacterized protein YfaS (alpha-2-macroglobulin family)
VESFGSGRRNHFYQVLQGRDHIKPNRLKIDLDFGTEELHASDPLPRNHSCRVACTGQKPPDLRTVSELTLKKGNTTFEDFSKYTFDLPNQTFYEESNIIVDDELDAEGNISFSLNVPDYSNAPGKLIARFSTRVFERGGEASIDMKDYWYSPYTSYAGVLSLKVKVGMEPFMGMKPI